MPAQPRYQRRQPERTILYGLVREHLETLLTRAAASGPGLPKFVEREFRRYLDCGLLCHGFLRIRCDSCGDDLLVAFSCKSRAICPSCATRRMHDGAAWLVARVLPRVRMRQWVMSFPRRIRLRLALDAKLASRVLAIFLRAVFAWQRRKARRLGLRGARTGAVTLVQRFSSALRLNVHFHSLIPDGVFASASTEEAPRWISLPAPTDAEVEAINRKVARKVLALLARLEEDAAGPPDDAAALVPVYAQAMQPALRLRDAEPPPRGRRCSNLAGFSLHAAVAVRGRDRLRLEQLCRYGLRPPFALERIETLPSGHIAYRMKRPAPDGATHRVMTPLEFLGALASLVPPPRVHLVRYHGVLAPNARDRASVVPAPPPADTLSAKRGNCDAHRRLPWADLLKKVFAIDVFVCGQCGGRRRLLAAITAPAAVRAILAHLHLPTRAPRAAPARPPPQTSVGFEVEFELDLEPYADPQPAYD